VSNFVYIKAKEAILNGEINFAEDNFKVLFTNSNYTANQSLDEFVSDIESSSIVYRSNNLANVSNINGVIDANDLSFTLSANIDFSSIILFQFKNSDQESRLITHIDNAIGLPYVSSSQPVSSTIVWSNLSGKILSI
jgi:hypothetical protein